MKINPDFDRIGDHLDIISNLTTPYEGYPVSALGMGAGLILVGILTSIFLSSLEDKTKR